MPGACNSTILKEKLSYKEGKTVGGLISPVGGLISPVGGLKKAASPALSL